MRFIAYTLITVSLSAFTAGYANAQLADNAVPDKNQTATVVQSAPATDTNMITSSLSDPDANADDLGMAPPGSNSPLSTGN